MQRARIVYRWCSLPILTLASQLFVCSVPSCVFGQVIIRLVERGSNKSRLSLGFDTTSVILTDYGQFACIWVRYSLKKVVCNFFIRFTNIRALLTRLIDLANRELFDLVLFITGQARSFVTSRVRSKYKTNVIFICLGFSKLDGGNIPGKIGLNHYY